MSDLFKDILIVELAGILAAPSAGMFFAELGARVIKVENSQGCGDLTRTWKNPDETSTGPSAYFASANYKKELIKANLNDPAGQNKINSLIARADIVLVNYKKGDAEKFKMDYNSLSTINSRLIYASVKGFENNDKPAFDVVLQAECGFMEMNGNENSGALKMPLAIVDVLAAHQLKQAILLALLKREKTGKGSYLEVSLERSAISALINQASNYLMNDKIPQRMGSLHPHIAPYGETFTCADDQRIVTAIGSDRHFADFCEILEIPQLATDPRFANNPNRILNRKELYKYLDDKIQQLGSNEISRACMEKKVPVGIVKNMEQVFENETAQSMILEEIIEGRLTRRVSSLGFNPEFLDQ